MSNNEAVKVAIRCRPMSSKEQATGHIEIVKMDLNRGEIFVQKPTNDEQPKQFTFDQVYDKTSLQTQIFENTAHPIIANVL